MKSDETTISGGQNMPYNYSTEKLLGLQDLIITNIKESNNVLQIFAKLEVKKQCCPCCGTTTRTIHDYRKQIIKDIPIRGKNVEIHFRKRRYRCPHCGKRFAEKNSFLPRYHRVTSRLVEYVYEKLREVYSFTSLAKELLLSTSTVIRYFDLVSYAKPKVLPNVIAIDEFKGNTDNEKYLGIITDPEHGIVLDILPTRHNYYLSHYFSQYTTDERNDVNIFISDMWKPYSDISSVFFKEATYVVDKYHWIRQVIWAFEKVRKSEQKKFSASHRRYFKRSKSLLNKHFDSLDEQQKTQVNVMLYASPTLSRAYSYKEDFLNILCCKSREEAQKELIKWINSASVCGIEPFQKCAKTMLAWINGILNSFTTKYTNGFTEGCNNKIKVLKRNAYGYRNFSRFRNRILHIFSNQRQATA